MKTNSGLKHTRAATWENQQSAFAKTKTQISFAVTAKLISAFVFATRIVHFLFFLNPKFQASSLLLCLYSPVCVGPGRKPHCWFSHEVTQLFWYLHCEVISKTLPSCRPLQKIVHFNLARRLSMSIISIYNLWVISRTTFCPLLRILIRLC